MLIFAADPEIPAGLVIVAEAGCDVAALTPGVTVLAGAALDRALDALDMLLHDDVDHAADRVRAVGR